MIPIRKVALWKKNVKTTLQEGGVSFSKSWQKPIETSLTDR
jgi:hypothetical protein